MAASFTPSLVCFLVLYSALQPALGRRELRRSIIDDLQAPAPAPAAAPLAAPAPAPEPWFPGASTTAAGFSMESPVEDVSMDSADPLTDQQFGAMMMGQAAGGDQSQQGAGDEVPRGGDLGQQPSDASAQDQPADSSAQDQPADASQGQAEQPADSSQDQQDQQDQLPADNNSSNSGSDSGSGQQDQQPSDSNNKNSNSDSSDKQDQKPSNNNDSKDSGSGQQGSTGTAEWDGQELTLQEGSLATIGDVPSVDGELATPARLLDAPAVAHVAAEPNAQCSGPTTPTDCPAGPPCPRRLQGALPCAEARPWHMHPQPRANPVSAAAVLASAAPRLWMLCMRMAARWRTAAAGVLSSTPHPRALPCHPLAAGGATTAWAQTWTPRRTRTSASCG